MKRILIFLIIVCVIEKLSAENDNRKVLQTLPETKYEISGIMGGYLSAITQNWLMVAPDIHPEMLNNIRIREEESHPFLVPWAGEFYGKYLTGAVQTYRLTRDPKLKSYLQKFVDELTSLQAEDGYLGVYDKSDRLSCKVPKEKYNGIWEVTWDLWGHYFSMMGLTLWYETTDDEQALNAAVKIADLFCDNYLGKNGELAKKLEPYTNFAPAHSLCLLYRITGEKDYLDLAKQIVDVEFPQTSVDYLKNALAGKEFYENRIDRWKIVHALLALPELYWLTGDEQYKEGFEKIWWSIAKYERFNHGAFTSGEEARGNPYDRLTKETCCTIAWSAMCVEMLKLTGDPKVADELELSLFNAIMGYQPLNDGHCHYHTPMDGIRPPIGGCLSCCTSNAARGFGLLSDWGLMKDNTGLVLNWFGPAIYRTEMNGAPVTIKVESSYPRLGNISIHVASQKVVKGTLKLRIPQWSEKTTVLDANGKTIEGVENGQYLTIDMNLKGDIEINVTLDMSLHYWIGERESIGRASIYYGPILLAMSRKNVQEYVNFDNNWGDYSGSTIASFGSNKVGAKFTYDFYGDELLWTGAQSAEGGKAELKIDGRLMGIINQTNDMVKFHCHSPVWTWYECGLGRGKHLMEVIIIDSGNPVSEKKWISVQEIITENDDPVFDLRNMHPRLLPNIPEDEIMVKIAVKDQNGNDVVLFDFDSAGEGLNPYQSWLRIKSEISKFSKENPLRSFRENNNKVIIVE